MRIEKLRKFGQGHFELLIILGVAVVLAAIWFRKGLLMGGGDSGLPLYDPVRVLGIIRYLWMGNFQTGWTYPHALSSLPLYLPLSLLAYLGVSYGRIQQAVFGALLVLSGLSMYYLVLSVVTENSRRLVGTLAALFYMLNPFMMTAVWHRFIYGPMFAMPLIPLTLAFYIRGIKTRRYRFVFLIGLSSLVSSAAFGAPAMAAAMWIPPLLYLLFVALSSRRRPGDLVFGLKFSLLGVAFWLLTSLWWLVPLLSIGPGSLAQTTTQAGNLASMEAVSKYFTLLHSLRGINSYSMFVTSVWGDVYSGPVLQAISWLGPIIGFSTLVLSRRTEGVVFFSALTIVALFLGKGASGPLGVVYSWLFGRSILSAVFRDPFEKLGLLIPLGLAFLFGVGLVGLYDRVRRRFPAQKLLARLALGATVVLVTGVYVWPMWTGQVFGGTNTEIYVDVPRYYQQADRWLSKRPGEFRLLIFPMIYGEGISYNWRYGYNGEEASQLLFSKPSIIRQKGMYVTFIDDTLSRIPGFLSSDGLWRVMSLLNAKYIVLHRDVNYATFSFQSPADVEKVLGGIPYVKKVKTFGKLDVYELNERFLSPRVYAASKSTFLVEGVDDLGEAIGAVRVLDGQVFFMLSPEEAKRFIKAGPIFEKRGNPPEISFKRIDPTMYHVELKNNSGPFYLVLSESFHPYWRLYKGKVRWWDALWKRPIAEDAHVRANGYANAWYLDGAAGPELTAVFWPQSLFYLGVIVSFIVFLIGLVSVIVGWRRSGS